VIHIINTVNFSVLALTEQKLKAYVLR